MDWLYTSYLAALFGSAAISILLAVMLWRRRAAPGALPLIILVCAAAEWSLGSAFQLMSHGLQDQLFWSKLQYPGIVSIPVAWIVFALQYTGRSDWLKRRTYLLLACVPILSVLLAWTNNLHHLMWTQVTYEPSAPMAGLDVTYNWGFGVHALYAYGLIAWGAYLIVSHFFGGSKPQGKQASPILIALSVPLLLNLVHVFKLSPFTHLDLTPVAFTITGVLLAIGLRRLWFFDLIPVARSNVIDGMQDGLFVMDPRGRIIDVNPAASDIIGLPAAEIIGKHAQQVFSAWPHLLAALDEARAGSSAISMEEITLGDGANRRSYELRFSHLEDRYSAPNGLILIWSDVTGRKIAAEALQASQQRYRQSVEKSPNPIFSVNRQGKIQTWNTSCESVFQYGQEILNQNYHTILDTSDEYAALDKMLARVFQERASYSNVDTIYRCKDDSQRYMVSRLFPVIDQTGVVETCVFANTDITERKQADEALRRRLDELTVLHATATACVEAASEDELIERVSNIIGKSLYTNNFGILMKNENTGALHFHPSYHGLPEEFKNTVLAKGQGITGQVALSGKTRRVSDVTRSHAYKHLNTGTRSELCVPIKTGDRTIGVVNAESVQPNAFSEADERVLNTISGQLATAIKRLRAEAAERQRADELLAVTRVSREITSKLKHQEVLDSIVRHAVELSGSDASGIFTFRPDNRFYLVATHGVRAAFVEAVNALGVPLEGSAVGRSVERLHPVQIPDVLEDPEYRIGPLAELENIRAILALPLLSGENPIGGIVLWHHHPYRFSSNEIVYLEALAQQSVNAIENARLFEETHHRAAQQEAINAIIAAAVIAPDIETLLQTALDLTMQALQVEAGGIWVPGHHALRGLQEEMSGGNGEIARSVYLSIPTTLAVSDWRNLDYNDSEASYLEHIVSYDLAAYLFVPVMVDGRRIGGMSMASTQPRTWLGEEIAMVEAVGRQVGSAVERINLLAKTQEQALQMQQIMDTVPEGVLLLNAKRKIVLANPAAREYLAILADSINPGEQLSRLAGQPVEDLLQQLAARSWHELELNSGNSKNFEIAARRLDNRNQDEGWVLVLRDVTQERENQSRIQMQERLATVGQLAAGIAHDFNNIMAAIVVYTDLLTMEPNLSPVSRERLTTIQQQVQRATSLIRQILDFSRRSVMEQSSLDLLPFIKELDKLLARVLPENIRMELAYKPGTYVVQADPTRLQQAFMNLALNARDAMPSGGILRFKLMRQHLSDEEISSNPDLSAGNWIHIEVKDTGNGIPADVLPHIFDPFFTTKPVGQGTGLGLAQVYGIIKQHRGSIDVQSQIGLGTSFIIYLPELAKLEQEPEVFEAFAGARGDGKTILVVEDDPAARVAFRALLEAQNYHVLTAENGAEAMQIYNRTGNAITAVVSDLVMPKMSGIPLYQALKMKNSNIKILFVTGHPLESSSQALLEEGRVHWLQKPFSAREFTQALQELLTEND